MLYIPPLLRYKRPLRTKAKGDWTMVEGIAEFGDFVKDGLARGGNYGIIER